MRTQTGRARAIAAGCALALALGLPATAAAEQVTVSNFDPFAFVTVPMDSGVSTLTLSRDPSGARRIHEVGAATR